MREVVSNNMKSENVPDKFKASKFDTDKLKERFSEYITAVKVRLSINAMFSNMREERWGRALDWGVVALQLVQGCQYRAPLTFLTGRWLKRSHQF